MEQLARNATGRYFRSAAVSALRSLKSTVESRTNTLDKELNQLPVTNTPQIERSRKNATATNTVNYWTGSNVCWLSWMPTPWMRFRIALLLSLCSALAGGSPLPDSTLGSYGLEARLTYGFLVAHRPMLRLLQEEHLRSFEVSLLFPSTGKKEWERGFRFPDRGLHLAIIDLGSRKLLGTGIAVYPFVDFPLFFGNDWSCRLRYGMGLGYVQHTFDPEENYKNTALSSHLNGTIHFDLHVNKCIGQRGAFDAGIGITHYSNGATALPNLGINLAAAHIGYRRYFGERRALHKETHDQRQLRPGMTLFLSGSLKEIYPPLGPFVFCLDTFGRLSAPTKPENRRSCWSGPVL